MPLTQLTKSDIQRGLERLSTLAAAEGVTLEIALYGGAVMVLAFDARPTTKDVDAIVHPAGVAMRLAKRIAREFNWHEEWLNDDVRMFVSPVETKHAWTPDGLDAPALKITKPTARYLLALKVMACRKAMPGYAGDETDIGFLARKMEITTVAEIEKIVDAYFPDTVLPAKTQLALETILHANLSQPQPPEIRAGRRP